jgi:hypothetical protein
MKPRAIFLVGGTVLLVGAGAILVPRLTDPPSAEAIPAEDGGAPNRPSKSDGRGPIAIPKQEAEGSEKPEALSEERRAAIFNEIEQASVTYDAKALPQIEPYLLHPDPEVRAAAMNGMIVLGDSAAAPLLRAAAEKAPTAKEAVALGDAADYMELPAGTFVPKERSGQGNQRKPLDGKPAERGRMPTAPQSRPNGE